MKFLFLLFSLPLFAVTYEDVGPIINEKCAACHKGPYLDLRTFPFYSDVFTTQEELMIEILRRAKLTTDKRMPPVNSAPLTKEEILKLELWFKDGLQ